MRRGALTAHSERDSLQGQDLTTLPLLLLDYIMKRDTNSLNFCFIVVVVAVVVCTQ